MGSLQRHAHASISTGMKLIALALVLGAAVGYARGGRLSRLSELRVRYAPLALLGLLLQLVNPPGRWPLVMLLASFVLLVIFIVAAILTPGTDVVSQAMMAGPMIVLYVLSIGIAWAVGKKKPAEDADRVTLVRGDITFDAEHVPDFALSRANGDPLYTLVNPVDDALMEITHVLRGEDLLSSTPRQLALFEALVALGIAKEVPAYGHLPYVMGQGNKKLSKRDPEAHALAYREQGFIPEGLLNYLALLGWSIAGDRDVFSMAEMVEAFDIADVNPNPARFDLKKAEAINTSQMRLLPLDEVTHRALPFLKEAGVVSDPVNDADAQMLALAMPLVAERINKLTEAAPMLGFLFVAEADFERDPDDVAKVLDETGRGVVQASYDALSDLRQWSTAAIEEALRVALIEGLGLKPRVAFGPVRVAVTGRRVSPPLFESMELLGRERSLARLQSALG